MDEKDGNRPPTGWQTPKFLPRIVSSRTCLNCHYQANTVRVEDKSVRYVAEENIEAINPEFSELPPALVAVAGKHFNRWDEDTRTFVSNIKDEYPED